jgi:hypothetical protein
MGTFPSECEGRTGRFISIGCCLLSSLISVNQLLLRNAGMELCVSFLLQTADLPSDIKVHVSPKFYPKSDVSFKKKII